MKKLKKYGRWAEWEQCILGRVADSEKVQALILKRQIEVDDDQDEVDIVMECIRSKIKSHTSPDNIDISCYIIPTITIAEWVKDVRPDKGIPTKVTPYLRTLGIPELVKASRNATHSAWIWRGGKASKSLKPRPLHRTNSFSDEDE